MHGGSDPALTDEALKRAFVTASGLGTSNGRFFEVLAEVICSGETHSFSFGQVVILGLSNLCHPLVDVRRQAFRMLESLHEQSSGMISMGQFEAAIGSSSPSIYLHACRHVSDLLANEHTAQSHSVLVQFTDWMPRICDGANEKQALLLLQSLEHWCSHINLMVDDRTVISREGQFALYHLMALTVRYGDSLPEQVRTLWCRLVDPPHQHNGHATIRFLLEQAPKVNYQGFIRAAAKIVASLCESVIGPSIFEDICSLIGPDRLLPNLDHKLAFPQAEDQDLWIVLDSLFPEQQRYALGQAQFAFLFLSDVAVERQWEMQPQLPVLLHAIFTHLDHRLPFVQEHAQRMFLQVLRSWVPGYDELSDRSAYSSRQQVKLDILDLERQLGSRLWSEDEPASKVVEKMGWLSSRVLTILQPLHPRLAHEWGTLAAQWGTTCPTRIIALRSLQIYRALAPPMNKHNLAVLLGRLSTTVADPEEPIQIYSAEMILIFSSMVASETVDPSFLPQSFWGGCACLSTSIESEFSLALAFVNAFLERLDLDNPTTTDVIMSHRPSDWVGPDGLQPLILPGLRSSKTLEVSIQTLQRLTRITDRRLIDDSDARLRDLYVLILPWCSRAMAEDDDAEDLREFALDIAHLADQEERSSLSRIMTSFAKNRFRTKDDFLRQSVSCLREHYATQWSEVVTLLLGLLLNAERWLRMHTLQILKALFKQNRIDLAGSEMLMPLLRLLETDLADLALEVLEEPFTISGGPSAKHILRMSMHVNGQERGTEPLGDVFGVPAASGWSVAKPEQVKVSCRHNVLAVFNETQPQERPSVIDFQPEDDFYAAYQAEEEERDDLGELVSDLHELSSFFQRQDPFARTRSATTEAVPSRQLEARVAAILAKSTDAVNIPQTPFVDVFRVGSMYYSDSSDNDSVSGSEASDPFEFDKRSGRYSPS
jgi:hypothetical protein